MAGVSMHDWMVCMLSFMASSKSSLIATKNFYVRASTNKQTSF